MSPCKCIHVCISSICSRTLYMVYLLSILVYCIFFIALYIRKNIHGMSASDGSGLIPNSHSILRLFIVLRLP